MEASAAVEHSPGQAQRSGTDTLIVAGVALCIVVLHQLTNSRYGFHRDELQVLSDARHLDWGFVPYPPFTPFVERIGLSIFGLSMVGLRFFSVVAQAAVILVSGLMARELGGGRWAQAAAAIGVALSPLPLFEGTEFQYTSFDCLWWVLAAYLVIRLLKSEDSRWCVPIGAVVGIGLMTKYTMVFFAAGIVVGLLLTPARRFLATRWFWIGMGLAFLIVLPNLIWQVRHNFISLTFLQYIHTRDVNQGRAGGFWQSQFRLCANRVAAPMWIAGVIAYLADRRYRTLGWMYLVPVLFFWVTRGRGYYTGGAYPMVIAMGGVTLERGANMLPQLWRRVLELGYIAGLVAWGAVVCTVLVPLTSSGPLRDRALHANGELREEIGWNELAKTVAQIRDSLPPEQRDHLGVLVGNYGEQGAIEILGTAYHLPPPVSGTNSAWFRSYPEPAPNTLIVIGFSRRGADEAFTSCRVAGKNGNREGVENEESKDHPDIFVCGPPRVAWPEFWKKFQRFG